MRSAQYSVNNLNQYTSRDVPGYVNVIGSANSNATVSLWTSDGLFAPTSRKGEYFRGELAVNNTTGAVWLTITNLAVLNNGTNADIVTNTVGNALLARTAEAFTYDFDGNLTSDGTWTNIWDAENRLISMISLSNAPSAAKRRLTFGYDSKGRRMTKLVETWSGSGWSVTTSNKFVYDGWNLIAQLNGTNNAVIRSYIWGLDLTGSEPGAGGVGGLVALNSTQGAQFPAFDANGNVAALVKASDGSTGATYEYGPFGELLRATGPMARTNPFRFSTKYQDDETDLLYYGYRYYNASTGRWPNRDPIGELGHQTLRSKRSRRIQPDDGSLYGFVYSDDINHSDALGLRGQPQPPPPPPRQPPNTDPVPPGECRIQVCCGKVFDASVFEHCYLRFDDADGVSGCRGAHSRDKYGEAGSSGSTGGTPQGCSKCCGYYGTITSTCAGKGEDKKIDEDLGGPDQACVTVAQGPEACALIDCLRSKMSQFHGRCYKYRVFGPNSNTAVATALEDCAGSAPKPPGVQAPGYRHANYHDDQCL